MLMQLEDFQNKMKDVQSMKVTREIQLYLTNADYDGRKQEEIGKLEQTILQQIRVIVRHINYANYNYSLIYDARFILNIRS